MAAMATLLKLYLALLLSQKAKFDSKFGRLYRADL